MADITNELPSIGFDWTSDTVEVAADTLAATAWLERLAITGTPVRKRHRTLYRMALVEAQDNVCALCLAPFRIGIGGYAVADLENVSGTLATDVLRDSDARLPYLTGGCVALHKDCNSDHDVRTEWMRANGVTHDRLMDTATSLAAVRW